MVFIRNNKHLMQEGFSMVSFSSAVSLGFQRYSEFSGRSTRAEYWWWTLFSTATTTIAQIIDGVIFFVWLVTGSEADNKYGPPGQKKSEYED